MAHQTGSQCASSFVPHTAFFPASSAERTASAGTQDNPHSGQEFHTLPLNANHETSAWATDNTTYV